MQIVDPSELKIEELTVDVSNLFLKGEKEIQVLKVQKESKEYRALKENREYKDCKVLKEK